MTLTQSLVYLGLTIFVARRMGVANDADRRFGGPQSSRVRLLPAQKRAETVDMV